MLTNRVTKRKIGYKQKKEWVRRSHSTESVVELVELRSEHGYLLGWEKEAKGLKVYLRYTEEGRPSVSKMKRRWKSSRHYTVDSREMWMVAQINGDMGTLVVQTTEGLITSVEARKKNLGGIVWMWRM